MMMMMVVGAKRPSKINKQTAIERDADAVRDVSDDGNGEGDANEIWSISWTTISVWSSCVVIDEVGDDGVLLTYAGSAIIKIRGESECRCTEKFKS